ncbi:MAG: FHA domain-containing protein [Bdellovibrionales bacterium]|nr:FHA domain-containing protein [Bdellovibrionales bacterium]
MKTMVAIPMNQSQPTALKLLNGSEKGAVFKILANEVTLGRGSDNDIPIGDDPTCSRYHARILFSNSEHVLENISERNTVLVNGSEIQKHVLKDQDEIRIGETLFKYVVLQEIVAPLTVVPEGPVSLPTSPARPRKPKKTKHSSRKKSSFNPVKLILYLVIAGMVYIVLQEPSAKKEETGLRDSEAMEAEIEAANKLREAAMMEKQSGQKNSRAYREAQAAYLRGFRDYQQGIYDRAMESFQACLSLVPNHALCQRYSVLSQRKFGELVQQNMVLGREYRDQNQFAACASAFSTVMIKVRDNTSAIYKEAKANYDACKAQLEGRY